ncbi:beta-lactamase/transpeptidase-like protein [Tricladium varicosporioides]|nr:beta-lactamase/transpeptidase-like protein [Hymenoscyphus varicosporioides]
MKAALGRLRTRTCFFEYISFMLILSVFLQMQSSSASEQHILDEQETINSLDAKFAELVKDTLNLWHVPGVAIAVVDGNNTWAEGYGIAKYPSTPVTPQTLFYTGSTTKAFTAAALSLLITSNPTSFPLGFKTPISSLLPSDFILQDPYLTTHITLEDTLSHRTGLPAHDFSYGGVDEKGVKRDVRDVVRSLRHLPLTRGLRERYQYCNVMFVVASYVVEKVSGMWLGDFLRERIWEPLGMRSTYFSTPAALSAPEPLAQGYVFNKSSSNHIPVPYMDTSVISGAGGTVSNVLDYAKWLRALMKCSGPISEDGYRELFKSRTLCEKDDYFIGGSVGISGYTLGWHTGVYHGHEYFQHDGEMEAFGATVIFFPSLQYGLVAFSNTVQTANAAQKTLLFSLIDDKLNVLREERFDWDEHNRKAFQEADKDYENARNRLYPNTPNPPLPPALPISSYTGTFYHPAYHNLTIALPFASAPFSHISNKLHISRLNAAWKLQMNLVHVSGEFWLSYIDSTVAPGGIFKQVVPMEFRISSEGVVREVGMDWAGENGGVGPAGGGDAGRVWFTRIDG